MIKIEFVEPVDPEWVRWRKQCVAKTKEVIDGGEPYHVTEYYKNQRESLFAAFHYKCVYCECALRPGQIGDVEHFRPKGAIADLKFKRVLIDAAAERPHPGYYWLAYELTNLIPACQLCNESGLGGGKRERFPLLDETKRAKAPGEEINEQPALINPATEDPAQLFVFCTETGTLGGKDVRATTCIDVFNLNREDLMRARRNAYFDTRQAVKSVLNECLGNEREYQRLIKRLQDVKGGVEPFALACRQALRDSHMALKRLFEVLLPLLE
jgi:hypothetical protein